MAKVVVKLKNARRLAKKLAAMPDLLKKPIRRAVEIGAVKIHRSAVANVQDGPATGKIYQKYNPRRQHQASARLESPAADTGALTGSITFEIHKDGLGADIGTNLKYGEWLETGTTHMEKRPWLFPAAEENHKRVVRGITKAVNQALKQTGD